MRQSCEKQERRNKKHLNVFVMTQEFVMSIPRKRRSTGEVTIADVAQLAGVGTMTVSRALRAPEQVSDKLREKSKRQCMSWAICLISPPARWRLYSLAHHRNGRTEPCGSGVF